MFKPTFKERFFVFKGNEAAPSVGSLDDEIDLSGFNAAQEKKKKVRAEKPKTTAELAKEAKNEAIDAQNNYAEAQDAATSAYHKIRAFAEANPISKDAIIKSFFYLAETTNSPYYTVSVVDSGDANSSDSRTASFQINTSVAALSASPDPNADKGKDKATLFLEKRDRFADASKAFRDLEERFNQSLSSVQKQQVGAANDAAKAEDGAKADRLIATLK